MKHGSSGSVRNPMGVDDGSLSNVLHINDARCNWIEQQLSRYIDGELAHDLETRVEVHLENCGNCQQALIEEQELLLLTIDTLVNAEPSESSAAFAARITPALTGVQPTPTVKPAPVSLLPRWVGNLAAIALLTAGLWLVSPDSIDPVGVSSTGARVASSTTISIPASTGDLELAAVSRADRPLGANFDPVSGDLDGDGSRSWGDLVALGRYVGDGDLNLEAILCQQAGDYDEDGSLTPSDLVACAYEQFSEFPEAEGRLDIMNSPLPCEGAVCVN